MELKPSKDKAYPKPRLDGIGGTLRTDEYKNPWASLARGAEPKAPALGLPNPNARERRRRWNSDTLGATPQRDGPWSLAAGDVALVKPPRTRKKRSADPGTPFIKPR